MVALRPNQTDSKPWYKQFWPWLIIFFPASAVVAGITTVIIAVVSDDGLVEKDYYKKGLLINISKKMDQRAEALGLSAYIRIEPGTGDVYVLMDQTIDSPQPHDIALIFKHATRADMDQTITITSTNSREFHGKYNRLVAGKWHIQLVFEDNWRLTGQISYPNHFDSQLIPAVL